MNHFLSVYEGVLRVCGPVFIGSGQDICKKEYMYMPNQQKVLIPDLSKMYSYLKNKRLNQAYEKYMLLENRMNLSEWMRQNRITDKELQNWISYSLDCGDAIWERGRQMEIKAFIKDAYGAPYVPGSSIKGMLRTILLAEDVQKNPKKYSGIKQEDLRRISQRANRNQYLKRETKKIEEIAFHTAYRTKTESDMVNDVLSGMIISDSRPLSVEDLTLCQKIEYHVDGSERRLNLLRECLKPHTEIHFTISIDESLCGITVEKIKSAIQSFDRQYHKMFSGKFAGIEEPDDYTVWLGGGAGYVSKTIIYNLFGEQGLKIVPQIYQNTNVPRQHKHFRDEKLGVSPHILKRTRFNGRNYEFGKCQIAFHKIS